jgi:hypothetical protein
MCIHRQYHKLQGTAQSICPISIRHAYAVFFALTFKYVLWRLVVWQSFHKAEVLRSHQLFHL